MHGWYAPALRLCGLGARLAVQCLLEGLVMLVVQILLCTTNDSSPLRPRLVSVLFLNLRTYLICREAAKVR